MKKAPLTMFCLLFLLLLNGKAAVKSDSLINNSPLPAVDSITKKTIVEELQFYGSLRLIGGISSKHNFAIRNNSSSIGFFARSRLTPWLKAVVNLEVGVGMAGTKQQVIFHGDPGGGVGEIDNVFTSRLGYLGFETKFGAFTWGKQWSPYYNIAGMTDQFMAYGAEAGGAFPNFTDGGISGTGRASNALQYNLRVKWFKLALQIQHRDITDVKKYPNSYCGSILFSDLAGFTFGASYNRVRDGIAEPKEYEPIKNDEAAIVGASWQNRRFTLSTTYSNFKNHMTDDKENYFDGWGLEVFSRYMIRGGWEVRLGGNYLKPTSDNAGDYVLRYLVVGTSYSFKNKVLVFIEFKIDDSINHAGTPGREDIYGFGMYYNLKIPKLSF